VRGCWSHRSYKASFKAPWCNNRGGKVARLHRRGKRHNKNDFMHHPTPRMTYPIHCGNITTVSKMVPHFCRGVYESSGFKNETRLWVRDAQSNESKGRSDTKDGQHFGAPDAPSRGPSLLKLHIRVQTFRFPSCPYAGWHLAVWVFCADYPRKSEKPPSPDLIGGGGALAPV
jgi:hypothetical protein